MKKLIPVEGDPNLKRDPRSGAVLNINSAEVREARKQKALRKQKMEEEKNLRETVANLESEMKDIKGLLMQLIEKK